MHNAILIGSVVAGAVIGSVITATIYEQRQSQAARCQQAQHDILTVAGESATATERAYQLALADIGTSPDLAYLLSRLARRPDIGEHARQSGRSRIMAAHSSLSDAVGCPQP